MSGIKKAGVLAFLTFLCAVTAVAQPARPLYPGASGQVPATRNVIPQEILIELLLIRLSSMDSPGPLMQAERDRDPEAYANFVKGRIRQTTLANDEEIEFLRKTAAKFKADVEAYDERNRGRMQALNAQASGNEAEPAEVVRERDQIHADWEHRRKEYARQIQGVLGDQRFGRLEVVLQESIGPGVRVSKPEEAANQ